MKIMLNLVLDGLKDLMKQARAHKTSLNQSQYETKICLKPTLKNKGDRNKVEHKRGGHLQKQSSLIGLGDKANMMVSTLNMP